MKRQILADVNSQEARVALIEDGDVAEIQVEMRGCERLVGNIYKGRVANILPGMQAAFIDIGLERNAFLYAGDVLVDRSDYDIDADDKKAVPNIKDILSVGDEIVVQILKQPGGTKGARVTTHITLPNRSVVLMPTVDHIGISRKIVEESERERLREMVASVKPEGVGIIVRTVGESLCEEAFKGEITFLVKLWEKIQQRADFSSAPRLLYAEETLMFRTIRDLMSEDVESFLISDKDYYEKALAVANITMPHLADRIQYYEDKMNIFDRYGIESKLEKALQRKVWLKSGSYLVIDEAEALTVIDVNTGKYIGEQNFQETILNANIEAANEIAKQIRLRGISGIIVIDFIDMEIKENRAKLMETLEEALSRDRVKTNVLGITELGLVQITRKKESRRLSTLLETTCPYCGGSGKIYNDQAMAMRVSREVVRMMNSVDADSYIVEVAPPIARYIKGKNNANEAVLSVSATDKQFYLVSNPSFHVHDIKVTPATNAQAKEKIVSSCLFC